MPCTTRYEFAAFGIRIGTEAGIVAEMTDQVYCEAAGCEQPLPHAVQADGRIAEQQCSRPGLSV